MHALPLLDGCVDRFIGARQLDDPHDGDVLYMEIENEIAQRVSDQLRSAASEAFVRIANEVLARAREQFKTP